MKLSKFIFVLIFVPIILFGKLTEVYAVDGEYLVTQETKPDDVTSNVTAAFDMVTTADYQFIAYYNKYGYMTVAKRSLDSISWQKKQLNTQIGWDSHNYVDIELDSEGYIHVAGNMHDVPSAGRYYKSSQPLDILSLQEQQNFIVGAPQEEKITYPQFFKSADGTLFFQYRYGSSGDGTFLINQYSTITKSWTRIVTDPYLGFQSEIEFGPNGNSWLPVLGDWDGDGDKNIGLFDAANLKFYLRNSNTPGNADITMQISITNKAGLVPIVGDWDGDSIDEVGIYDPSIGKFYLMYQNVTGTPNKELIAGPTNNYGCKPVAGNWGTSQSDKRDRVGVYCSANGKWYLATNIGTINETPYTASGYVNSGIYFGEVGKTYIPFAGDFNRDGVDTIGLVDKSINKAYFRNTNTSGSADYNVSYTTSMSDKTVALGELGEKSFMIAMYSGSDGKFYIKFADNNQIFKTVSPYPVGPVLGPDGYFHIVYTWRGDQNAENTYQIGYMKSPDLIHWFDKNNQPLTLPVLPNAGDIVDITLPNQGVLNSLVRLNFDSSNKPVIFYHKYNPADNYSTSQVFSVRMLTNGTWSSPTKLTNWSQKWSFSGGGSLNNMVNIGEPVLENSSHISLPTTLFKLDSQGKKVVVANNILKVDSQTLAVPGYYTSDIMPVELSTKESTDSRLQVNRIWKYSADRNKIYVMKWEAQPANGDSTGTTSYPSQLYVYELDRVVQ